MHGRDVDGSGSLEDEALGLLPLLSGGERGTGCVLKDLPDAFVGLGRALDVLLGSNLVLDLSRLDACQQLSAIKEGPSTYLILSDGCLRGLVKLFDRLRVVSEILLASDENNGQALAEMKDLGDPL